MELSNKIASVKANRIDGLWNINLIPRRSIGPQLTHINEWWEECDNDDTDDELPF